MTPREYAISLGLAKPGRGKLSNAAHAAINKARAAGTKFSDGTIVVQRVVKEKPKKNVAEAIVHRPAVRKSAQAYIMEGNLRVGFDTCSRNHYLTYCDCPIPYAPAWIGPNIPLIFK